MRPAKPGIFEAAFVVRIWSGPLAWFPLGSKVIAGDRADVLRELEAMMLASKDPHFLREVGARCDYLRRTLGLGPKTVFEKPATRRLTGFVLTNVLNYGHLRSIGRGA